MLEQPQAARAWGCTTTTELSGAFFRSGLDPTWGQGRAGAVSDPGYWYDDLGWYAMILPYIGAKPIYDSINFDTYLTRWNYRPEDEDQRLRMPLLGADPNEFDSVNAADKGRASYRGNTRPIREHELRQTAIDRRATPTATTPSPRRHRR